MELILNINQYDYKNFINSKVDTLLIGVKSFCVGYPTCYELENIKDISIDIHKYNKKLYLSFNIIANEAIINELKDAMDFISSLNIDGFVISDFGILQLFIEHKLTNKVIFNPITTLTNKYAAKVINDLGIHHCCIANELNIKDILDIAQFNDGNIEILAQGYYQIGNSKRHLINNFFKKFKIKNNSSYYKIKEESRDYAYPIIELNDDLIIYIDKERTILPYFKQIKANKIKYIRIDTMFLDTSEINMHIDIYNKAILDDNSINDNLMKIQTETNSNMNSLDNISILVKEKKNEK